MQLTGELAPLGYAHRETEFIYDSAEGRWITGDCGANAYAAAKSATHQSDVETQAVFDDMRGRGLCDANGVTTTAQLHAYAQAIGDPIAEFRDYTDGTWPGYDTFLGWHLNNQHAPVLLFVENGQVLHDELSNEGEDAVNLHGHFITLLAQHDGGHSDAAGRDLDPGYWAADGANRAAGDVLQFYSKSNLLQAAPAAGIAFTRVVAPPAPQTVPAGWKDEVTNDGATLTAPNGVPVVRGFRLWVLTHAWDPANVPLAPEAGADPALDLAGPAGIGLAGTAQVFAAHVLSWRAATNGVSQTACGPLVLAYRKVAPAPLAKTALAAPIAATNAVGGEDVVIVAGPTIA